MLYLKV